jgi:predicted enzyme related to lactoylglutathione lyase
MANPVVHFEIIGKDAEALRIFYGTLFGWSYDTDAPVAAEVSAAGNYGFIRNATEHGTGIPGGIGGGQGYTSHAVFYVGVDDVEATLAAAVSLGATRVFGPTRRPDGGAVVGQFLDPECNLIGVAGPK